MLLLVTPSWEAARLEPTEPPAALLLEAAVSMRSRHPEKPCSLQNFKDAVL